MSSWFRDYVYIPLGGSRCTATRTAVNIGIVWLLTSLWHGFSWNFLLWGDSYFIFIILEKYLINPDKFQTIISRCVYRMLTLIVVAILWVSFRSASIEEFIMIMRGAFGIGNGCFVGRDFLFNLRSYLFPLCVGIFLASPASMKIEKTTCTKKTSSVVYEVAIVIVVMVLFIVSVSHILMNSYNPFLYFMF